MPKAFATFRVQFSTVPTFGSCLLFLAAIGFLSLTGCQNESSTISGSDANMAETNQQLSALGKAYHSFHLTNKKGPANWEDAMSSGDSAAIASLQSKGCLVAWGIRFRDATVGASNFLLAYLPTVKDKGGLVLLLDGSVLRADPERIKKMLEAQAEIGVPQ